MPSVSIAIMIVSALNEVFVDLLMNTNNVVDSELDHYCTMQRQLWFNLDELPNLDVTAIRTGMSTTLKAPIAFLDEGFSSDGAFVSGAETDAGTPIIEEATDMEGPSTPHATDDLPDLPLPPPPEINNSPWGKQGVPDEKWESAGLIDHGDDSPEEVPLPPQLAANFTATLSKSPTEQSWSPDIRTEFEIQALSRPRPTTPVQSSAIEKFVATAPAPTLPDENAMKINLPSSVAPISKTPKLHRRRSSQSWSEFADSMSQSKEPDDMFMSGEVPKDKVPPSPVVHRRSSQDWVSFEDSQVDQSNETVTTFSQPLPKLEDYLAGREDFDSQPFSQFELQPKGAHEPEKLSDTETTEEHNGLFSNETPSANLPSNAAGFTDSPIMPTEQGSHSDAPGTFDAATVSIHRAPPPIPTRRAPERPPPIPPTHAASSTSSYNSTVHSTEGSTSWQCAPMPEPMQYNSASITEAQQSLSGEFEVDDTASVPKSSSVIVDYPHAPPEPDLNTADSGVMVPPTVIIDQHFIENPEYRYSSSSSESDIKNYVAQNVPKPVDSESEPTDVSWQQTTYASYVESSGPDRTNQTMPPNSTDETGQSIAPIPEVPDNALAQKSIWQRFDSEENNYTTQVPFGDMSPAQKSGVNQNSMTSITEMDQTSQPIPSYDDENIVSYPALDAYASPENHQDTQLYPDLPPASNIAEKTSEDALPSKPQPAAGSWTTFEDDEPSSGFTMMNTTSPVLPESHTASHDTSTTRGQAPGFDANYDSIPSQIPEHSSFEKPEPEIQTNDVTAPARPAPPRPRPPPPRPTGGPTAGAKPLIKPLANSIKISLPSMPSSKKSESSGGHDSQDVSTTGDGLQKQDATMDGEDSSSDEEPYVPPSASPPRMEGDEHGPAAEKGPSEDWKAFLQMSDRVTDLMKQTQDKLKTMKENTTIKDLRNVPKYMNMRGEDGERAETKDIMDVSAKTPDPDKEWKDVTQVLNAEIKKQKDKNKPSRPPPPTAAPAAAKPKPTRNPSVVSYDPLNPSWDDDTVQEYYKAASYAQKTDTEDSNAAGKTIEELEQEEAQEGNEDAAEKDPEQASEDVVNGNAGLDENPSWTPMEEAKLPSSHSDFFSQAREVTAEETDPFSITEEKTDYDPFEVQLSLAIPRFLAKVKPVEEILKEAKEKAEAESAAAEANQDLELFGALAGGTRESSATGSPDKPDGFDDAFVKGGLHDEDDEDDDDAPLYDEDDSEPLEDYPPKFTGDGWDLLIRYPLKKKFIGDRYWKPIYVRFRRQDNVLALFHAKTDQRPFQETPILPNYSLSTLELQPYDIYSKTHTVKLQHVTYQERVGVRPGQIPKIVQGHFSKLGMPLEHAAVCSQIVKLGCLDYEEMLTFVRCVEDALFKVTSHSAHLTGVQLGVQYKQDEVQIHVYDEYQCNVDKDGIVSEQLARVRIFCLAFLTGAASVELGLNDRRRQGKEVVRRKDIMPLYTDRWIRFECLEFHSVVDKTAFDGSDHVINFRPMDACFFELMRFRVRPPKNKELPLKVHCTMNICGSKIEIRLEALVAGFRSRKAHQIPCEDIQIRFPIPEAWIYLFREERHWGVGSVHGKVRRPGKMKNIKDKLMGMVQHIDNCLIEIATGEAKYEHVYRALVWRIPRLPEKHHGAYKNHLLRCRFELSSFDLMPETFLPTCDVEFTMPMCTVSSAVVRSVSVNQHEDPDTVEKFVRYVAKYQYKVEVDYVQVSELDVEAVLDPTVLDPEKTADHVPAQHAPSIDPDAVDEAHDGYKIEFDASEFGEGPARPKADSSSSDDDDDDDLKRKPLKVNIDMTKYAY